MASALNAAAAPPDAGGHPMHQRPDPEERPAGFPDEQAGRLLLAFARLSRGSRHVGGLPKRLATLVGNGQLAPRHLSAFAVIALEGPMTVSELAAHEGLAVSTASLLTTQLADAGLVERREDAQDRRRTVVSVAPAHRSESEQLLESKLAPMRRALARLGHARARALFDGLEVVAEEMAAPPAPSDAEAGRR
jgi:DNA-binding MarR family transcriptional regulator